MRVEFIFDKAKVQQRGYTLEAVYHALKKNFEAKHLHCIAEHEILAFTGHGNEGDFSSMWAIIMALLRTEWFHRFAASCVWYDDDGTEEDVLAQAWKVQKQSHCKKILILARLGVKFTPNLAFSTFGNKFDTQIQRRR